MILSLKQLKFIDHYMETFNGAEAARRAGYAERSARVTAAQLLTNPNIRAEIQRRSELLAMRFELRREDAIREMLEAVALAKLQGNVLAMIEGWREIAKMCGFYNHITLDPDQANSVIDHLELMSDESLQNFITTANRHSGL